MENEHIETLEKTGEVFIMKVSRNSNAKSLGSSIAKELEKRKHIYVRAIGVNAVNQATKGIGIAGGFLGQKGLACEVRIGFYDVPIDEKKIVAIDREERVALPTNASPYEIAECEKRIARRIAELKSDKESEDKKVSAVNWNCKLVE